MGSAVGVGKNTVQNFLLVLSAMMNDLNPRVYIYYLLNQIHAMRTKKVDPATLLPHVIDKNKLQAFANEQIEICKEVLDSP